jgi:hypothetical protein
MQIPYHNKRSVAAVTRFIEQYQPDEIASVGDEVDFPQISRWNSGMAGEYAGDLQAHVDQGVKVFEGIRKVFSGPFHISRSNHMDRPLQYIRKKAPGLMGLRALTVPSLLEFDRLDITYHEAPYELAPGWLLAHGDEGSSVAPSPGGTAMRLARKWGKSVVCGHTHKLGLTHDHSVVNGKTTRTLYGLEVGNLMDIRKAHYLGAGHANWTQGFGLLYIDGKTVSPQVVTITNGKFVVEGKQYS